MIIIGILGYGRGERDRRKFEKINLYRTLAAIRIYNLLKTNNVLFVPLGGKNTDIIEYSESEYIRMLLQKEGIGNIDVGYSRPANTWGTYANIKYLCILAKRYNPELLIASTDAGHAPRVASTMAQICYLEEKIPIYSAVVMAPISYDNWKYGSPIVLEGELAIYGKKLVELYRKLKKEGREKELLSKLEKILEEFDHHS